MTVRATFTVDNDPFLEDLAGYTTALGRTNERDVQRLGELAAEKMREIVAVDTGELRDSIRSQPGRDEQGGFVDVGSFDNDHNWFVEFGTSRMPAQPYQRPGLAEAVVEWVREGPQP